MTITYGPVDATSGSPAFSGKQERQMRAPLLGNPTGRVLGGRSGWRVGTQPSVVTVTSTTWTLNPCSAMIEPAAMLYQGAYPWASDQAISGAVTAADATNPRIDILYIQINDSSSGDGSGALSAPVNYLAGTAAATPQAPTLPPRSFLVATINVPKADGGTPTVTFNAQYFVAAGASVPVLSQAERDTFTQYDGLKVIRLDKGGVEEVSVGGSWQSMGQTSYTPVLSSSGTQPNIGSGQQLGTYQVVGKTLVGQAFISFNGGSVGTGNYGISLPPGFTYGGLGSSLPVGIFTAHVSATVDVSGFLRLTSSGASSVNMYWQSATTTASPLTATTGSWAASATYIAIQFTVPLA